MLMRRVVLREIDGIFSNLSDDTRVVVISSASPESFMVGGDLHELGEMSPDQAERLTRYGMEVFDRIRESHALSVAVIDGYALGAGFLLALACDFRVATPRSSFGFPEIKAGLMPGAGATDLLVRLVGLAVARSICLKGDMFSAERAFSLGLVDLLLDEAELTESVERYVSELADLEQYAVRLTKRALNASAYGTAEEARKQEILAFRGCFENRNRRVD